METEQGIITTEELFGDQKTFTTEQLFGGKTKPSESSIWKLGKTFVGAGESAIKLGGDIVKFIPTGILEGMMAIFPEDTTVHDIARAIQQPIQKGLTYEPKTEEGKTYAGMIEWPFKKFDEWGDSVGDYIRENSLAAGAGPEEAAVVATTIGGAIKFLPYSLGLKATFKGPKPPKIISDRRIFEELNRPVDGLTLEPDVSNVKVEPSISMNQLETTPSLKDYVLKRSKNHSEEVNKLAEKLQKEEEIKIEAEKVVKPEVKPKTEGINLQSTIIPGGKEFLEQDIIPKAKQLGNGLVDTWERFKNLVIPRSGVPREELDIIMKKKGELDKATTLLEATTRDVERKFDKLSKQDQIDFIDNMKRGNPQPDPQLDQISDMIRTMDDALGLRLLQYNPDMNWIENHFRVLYKTIPGTTKEGFKGVFTKPLEGTKGFFKQHTLADLSEGIALGGEPITYNPMRMFRYHYADAMKYITTQNMWEELGNIDGREFVRFGKKAPEGFVRLNDRIANVYFKVPQGMVKAGEWYVEEGAGRLLNGYLSRDLIRETAAGRGLMWVKNSTTAVELGFVNTFHGTFETLESVASAVAHGTRTIWNEGIIKANIDKIIEGHKEIFTAPGAAIEKARIGGGFVRYIENKQHFLQTMRGQKFIKQFPDVETLIDDLFSAGMKGIGIHEDYRIGSIQTFKENRSSNNYIGAAIRSIPAFNEVLMKPLFDIYIPRMKIGVWAKEFSAELARRSGDIVSGKITRSELARNIWDFTENRFGEMNFDNIFWNRTFKTGLQAMIRSVTWKLGNIKLFGKAPIEQSKEFYNAFKEGRIPELTQEMAWVWGIAVTHAAISSIVQTVLTGEPPSEFKDFFWPKVDKEGNRISPATYMRDLFSLVKSPTKYVQHSMAGYIGRFIEVLNNKNFYGVEVHNAEDGWAQQRIDDLIHMVPVPFGISSMLRLHEQGLPTERAIIANFGFTKAPFYIEQSEAEQKAGELVQGYMMQRPKTKEEFARAQVRKEYAKKIQKTLRDKPQELDVIIKEMAKDIENHKLSMNDIDGIKNRLRTPLEGKFGRLTLHDQFLVWDICSREEKTKLKNILFSRIDRTKDVETLEKLKPQIENFFQEVRGGLK